MRTFNLDILEFVKTGNFCDLTFGLSKDDLISIDMIPDGWGGHEAENRDLAAFWSYGNIEFYFDKENKFDSIWCDSVNFKIQGSENIIISNYWLLRRRKITLSKTISEILKLNLDFDKKFIQPGFIEITLKNGVYFAFDFVNNELDPHSIWTMTAIGKRNVKE
jgi:hypothetical protein